MSKQKLNADERLAAMQERLDRATAKSDLAQQMQVCANNRDALADRLNRVIAVAEWRRVRVRELEKENSGMLSMLNAFLEQQNKQTHER